MRSQSGLELLALLLVVHLKLLLMLTVLIEHGGNFDKLLGTCGNLAIFALYI
jgi:hypothetical protein